MYYKGSKVIIIVYDITNTESFDGARKWVDDLKNHNNTAILALIGNKIDLQENRMVSYETAKLYSVQNNLIYFEASAKLNHNVSESFLSLIEKIPKINENNLNVNDTFGKKLNENANENKDKTKGYCC